MSLTIQLAHVFDNDSPEQGQLHFEKISLSLPAFFLQDSRGELTDWKTLQSWSDVCFAIGNMLWYLQKLNGTAQSFAIFHGKYYATTDVISISWQHSTVLYICVLRVLFSVFWWRLAKAKRVVKS